MDYNKEYVIAALRQEEDSLRELAQVEEALKQKNTLNTLSEIADSLIDKLCVESLNGTLSKEQMLETLLVIKVNRDAVRKYKGASEKHNTVLGKLAEVTN